MTWIKFTERGSTLPTYINADKITSICPNMGGYGSNSVRINGYDYEINPHRVMPIFEQAILSPSVTNLILEVPPVRGRRS